MFHIPVEPGHRCKMTGFLSNPELRESFQGTVYGCTRYTGDSAFDVIVYLIDGRMILAVQKSIEDDPRCTVTGKPRS